MSTPIRLNKWLALATGYSRRFADELIDQGRVKLNGAIAVAGDKVATDDAVLLDGRKLELPESSVTFAFYKPRGFATTLATSRERARSIAEILPEGLGLKPAGRLDVESEGLLIVSSDGDLLYQITHPKFEMEKEYVVTPHRFVSDAVLAKMERGVMLDDGMCKPDAVGRGRGNDIRLTLHEGRNREIRRLLDAVGFDVIQLIRIRIGSVKLGNLAPGDVRTLTAIELASLQSKPVKSTLRDEMKSGKPFNRKLDSAHE